MKLRIKISYTNVLALLLMFVAMPQQSCKKDESNDPYLIGPGPPYYFPRADFIADKTTIYFGQPVQFTDHSLYDPDTWEWEFGDGNHSTDQNPSHLFGTTGTFDVSLKVSNARGWSKKTKSKFIRVNQETVLSPCPETPTVWDADGNIYNTVLIGEQCWMKENLKVGLTISHGSTQTDNGKVERYCYDNDHENCDRFGGLYQWHEMMDYKNEEGVQGICPPGWHVPTDHDWKILEGNVDSIYGVGSSVWDTLGWRGSNAGFVIRSNNSWHNYQNGSDAFGLAILPAGYRYQDGFSFSLMNKSTFLWSSSEFTNNNAIIRHLNDNNYGINRANMEKNYGYSVRCIKN